MQQILKDGARTAGAFQIPICGYKEMILQFDQDAAGPDKNPFWPCANVS